MRWEVLHKSPVTKTEPLIDILLNNRGIKKEKEKKEFFNPTDPTKITLKSLGIKEPEVKKIIQRINKAKKNGEFVIIYGDYDADGITATAILWETLHEIGLEVLPFIPDRFEDGYGIKPESVEKLKKQFPNLSLIITVDNGIVAYKGVEKAGEMGIDVIIIDHHQKGLQKLNTLFIIHSTFVCGSALAWFFSREIIKRSDLLINNIQERLQLAAIGTIADQLPLTGSNRSIVKYGLVELNKTKRPGLLELFKEARLTKVDTINNIGTYEVGYVIAPRINAMGRLKHGIESLRLLCTKNREKAFEIASGIGRTNSERQKIVEEVLLLARKKVTNEKVIVIAGENYHEGVIGLAAGRLVEEFYRPAIVLSVNGDVSKASARSISGFNIIEAIRSIDLHIEGGGHPMAAGFSITTENIEIFSKKINKFAEGILTDEMLQKKLKIDCQIDFELINMDLVSKLKSFEPTGLGNFTAVFLSKKVEILDVRPVGREARHLKLKLKQNEHIFDSIFFGGGENYSELAPGSLADVVYSVEENVWNGNISLQLKIKDINKY
jgi:single-stranded-DNA-specific exonuclease